MAALVACNLIAKKFTVLDFGFHRFTVSVGILPYPVTFLVTDVLSEVYGKRRANQVVMTGFFGSVFVLGIISLALATDAMEGGTGDAAFREVFGSSWRVILASMVAYLVAQLVDVQLFHFCKDLTRGRYLWLRNNVSTICSQLVDTILVVVVLFAGVWSTEKITDAIVDGWYFKVLCALADTPFAYLGVYLLRRYLSGDPGGEPAAH